MRFGFASLFVGALLASACSGDAPVDAVVKTPFTVWVFDERLTLDGQDEPIGGAPVAFDPPGGERILKTTEADGHVTFEADFSRGGASVTVLSPRHVYTTMLEASPETTRRRPNPLGKPAADLVVFPPRFDEEVRARSVELRGSLIGKRDRNHVVSLAVSSLARLGAYDALESTFLLRAPRDRAFFLLGHETKTFIDKEGFIVENELIASFRLDLPARSDDQLLDLDLPKLSPLPKRPIRVRMEAPSDTFGRAVASVKSADSDLTVGLFARSNPSADGRAFDVDLTLVDTDVAPERLVSRAILTAADGTQTVRSEPGVMADGFTWRDFRLPPSIANPDASRTIRDPIPLDGFPAGADLLAKVYAAGQLFWVLHGPPGGPGAKTFSIPYRDEVGSADVQLFALSLSALADRVELTPRGELHRAISTSRDIVLRRR